MTEIRLASERLESCLARIADPSGEGARACVAVYETSARAAAEAADRRFRAGMSLGPLDGKIVSIKDLFDVRGEVTSAGSVVLAAEGKVAEDDAEVVHMLQAAGAVIAVRTGMSEFAFSGVGTNPHFGTPANPLDRSRIPGGSSSGAAVAVADGFCEIAIGTDTGGSLRIPAALCGLTGFKPTQARISRRGVFPLSATFDSVGPIGKSVDDCIRANTVLCALPRADGEAVLDRTRMAVVAGLPFERIDPNVDAAFRMAVRVLSAATGRIDEIDIPELEEMRQVNLRGGTIVAAEAYALHRERLDRSDGMDPNIAARIAKGASITHEAHAGMLAAREALMKSFQKIWRRFDVLVLPTVPIPAPEIAEVADPEVFNDCNLLLLRNTAIANFFDCPAISLPIRHHGSVHSVMLMGPRLGDLNLLATARAVESCLQAGGAGFQYWNKQ